MISYPQLETTDDIPWATFSLSVGMMAIYISQPGITSLSYTVLAPWMHAGANHFLQNLFVFFLLGSWVEKRVGWLKFLSFCATIPYLTLYLPVFFNYGGLSRGVSGLTMALTGYLIPVLLIGLHGRVRSSEFGLKEVVIGFGLLFFWAYLTADAWVTLQRFVGFGPQPGGVAVSAHATGLAFGLLWFGWRMWRYGIHKA